MKPEVWVMVTALGLGGVVGALLVYFLFYEKLSLAHIIGIGIFVVGTGLAMYFKEH